MVLEGGWSFVEASNRLLGAEWSRHLREGHVTRAPNRRRTLLGEARLSFPANGGSTKMAAPGQGESKMASAGEDERRRPVIGRVPQRH